MADRPTLPGVGALPTYVWDTDQGRWVQVPHEDDDEED